MKVKDGIIGFAVGDALGVPVEFCSRENLKKNKVKDMQGFGTHLQEPGTFSDDTAMVLATISSLIEKNGLDFNNIADKYLDWYEMGDFTANGEVFDIGITVRQALENWKRNFRQPSGLKDIDSNGNGSLMRVLPLAYYFDYKRILASDRLQLIKEFSSITHAHEISCFGCMLYSEFALLLLNDPNPFKAYELLKSNMNSYSEIKNEKKIYYRILNENIFEKSQEEIRSTSYIVDTLEAVFWTILTTHSYKEATLTAVNLGGDTDTIAALVGGLAGIIYGYEHIPNEWINTLKRKEYLLKMCEQYEQELSC